MKTLFKISLLAFFLSSFTTGNAKHKKQTTISDPNKQFIKVALLLDTSNSMDGLIDQAKAQLWEIVNELSYAKCKDNKPYLQIAVYEYGNDKLNGHEGYIRQVLAFSEDLDEISKELFSLTTNGGNEYCGQVLQVSLDQLQWGNNPDDLKLIFIAGNEPFTQGEVNYKEASKNALGKDVIVNTIFCGDYKQGVLSSWKDGADIAHGSYIAINQNHTTIHIASPYDNQILQLNIKLNKTYVAYGIHGRQKITLQSEQDNNAKEYSNANAVSRTISKSSHLYKNSSWDLVDAEESETFKYSDLKEKDLPKELQGKSEIEIKSFVSKKRKERSSIQEEIQALNLKRKNYILKHPKENKNALESAMLNAIKIQALNKNYLLV